MIWVLAILLILFLFGLGLTFGPALVNYQGYFLVVLESGTFQLSIFGFVVALALLFVATWLTILLFSRLIKMFSGSQTWLFGFGERKRKKAFATGLISLAEGDYIAARKNLLKVENHDFDGVNLLALAEAEAQLGNMEHARAIWQKAATNPKTQIAANLCILREMIATDRCKQALTYIDSLEDKLKSHSGVIRLWAKALALTGNYQRLNQKLPGWKKALGSEYDGWVLEASKGKFSEIASKQGANQLKETWHGLPRSVRKEPAQRAAYAQQLIRQGMFDEAERALVQGQKAGPHPTLLPLFRQLKSPQPTAAKKLLESWLKQDESNVELLSTLGELAYNSEDFALAEKALGKAIKLASNKHDILLMAKLKEAQKDNLHALELYKQSSTSSAN